MIPPLTAQNAATLTVVINTRAPHHEDNVCRYVFVLAPRPALPAAQTRRKACAGLDVSPGRIPWMPGPLALLEPAREAEFRAMGSTRRLTGVAGRWSASHPWTAIAAWIGSVVVLMVTGHLAGTLKL